MKRKPLLIAVPVLALAFAIFFIRCEPEPLPPDGSEANPYLLTSGVWAADTLPADDSVVWYSFPVDSGTTYYIWVVSYLSASVVDADKYASVATSAKYNDGTFIYKNSEYGFNDTTTAASPSGVSSHFTADQNGTVLVKVNRAGVMGANLEYINFKVAYSTTDSRPANE